MWLVRFAKVTIHIGESTTELLLCLFWCDALFLRRVADQSVHNGRVVWKRPVLLRTDRSIDRAPESTLRNSVRGGKWQWHPSVRAAHHLTTLNSCYVCHLPATRRPPLRDTVLPVHSRNLGGDSFRVRERHPARLEFQYMPDMIPIRESSDTPYARVSPVRPRDKFRTDPSVSLNAITPTKKIGESSLPFIHHYYGW